MSGKQTVLKLKKENFKIVPSLLFPSLALGIAPFVMQSTESLISLCFNMQLSKFGGDVAIGSMTILTSVMQFAMMPLQGLTQGGQPIKTQIVLKKAFYFKHYVVSHTQVSSGF